MSRQRKHPWPDGERIALKCESDQLAYDQSLHVLLLREVTDKGWIGWPLEWKERGLGPGKPLLYPSFAWRRIA